MTTAEKTTLTTLTLQRRHWEFLAACVAEVGQPGVYDANLPGWPGRELFFRIHGQPTLRLWSLPDSISSLDLDAEECETALRALSPRRDSEGHWAALIAEQIEAGIAP